MKKIILSLVLSFAAAATMAQMDIPGDGGNIRASVSEDIGISNISVRYSRPHVKGREGKIWGIVVPNGFNAFNFVTSKPSSPWRAGANEATVITFEHDVKVEGKDLKAGAYALFMAMGKDTVTVIFSKEVEAWGTFYYRPEDDVLRVYVKPVALDKSVEWLKYEFIDQTDKSAVLAMQWEKLSVPIRFDVDVDNIVLNRIREQLIGPKGFASGNLIQISRYASGKNLYSEESLGWARRAVTGEPYGQTTFEGYRTLAIAYEKLQRLSEADSVMNIALATSASMAQYINYGKTMLAQKRADRALDIFLIAQTKFGDVYSVNNVLSYAYSAKGDYANALKYAQKALAQAPVSAKPVLNTNIEKLKSSRDIN
jgi:hypothetical protein